jgi:hypothetical protein
MANKKNNSAANTLLTAGMLAGPVYVGLAVLQMLIRPGFDPTRHDWSLLSNGQLGWIQTANFLITGILVICAGVGVRQVLSGGKGGTWVPRLLGLYGAGLIGAGLFKADPMNGFPPGTPSGAPLHPTPSGTLHIVTGAFGFIGLIAACFVSARYFQSVGKTTWARFSTVTGIVFMLAFFGIAGSSQQQGAVLQTITLAFTAAVILSWAWMYSVSQYLKKVKS